MPRMSTVPRIDDEKTDRAIAAAVQRISTLERSPVSGGVILEDVDVRDEFKLNVQHGLGRKARGVVVVGSDAGNIVARLRSSRVDSALVSLTSDWEMIDYEEIFEATDTITFDGLDGDEDGEYRLEGLAVYDMGVATDDIIIKPNGATDANMYTTSIHAAVGTSPTGTHTNALILVQGTNLTADTHAGYSCAFQAGTGGVRARTGLGRQNLQWGATASNIGHATHGLNWNDVTTAITSLDVFSEGGATSLKPGTTCKLSRRPKLNGRKLNLWVF